MEFDPRKHPKDRLGRFREILGGLEPGESVHLPGGLKVQRNPSSEWIPRRDAASMPPNKFLVTGGDTKRGHLAHSTPGSVAEMVLDYSARSTHKDSLGGERSYTTLSHYEARERKVEAQREQIKRSRAGELPKPPMSPGTTGVTPEEPDSKTGFVRGRKLRVGDYLHPDGKRIQQGGRIVKLHHFGYSDQPYYPVKLDSGEMAMVGFNHLHKITRDMPKS